MNMQKELVQTAYSAALRERYAAKKEPHEAVCIFDCVEKLGVEVRFDDISSLEGMYYFDDERPLIIISSCRPRGRRAFNCAHEYAHHVFGHGTRVDKLGCQDSKVESDNEEFLANCFAASFLMPQSTVSHAFAVRGWDPGSCTPEQAFVIAGFLGVGYETILTQMYHSLKLFSYAHFNSLATTKPKDIKSNILGVQHKNELLLVDRQWEHKAVDICVGDKIVLPTGCTVEGTSVEFVEDCTHGPVVCGFQQGIDRVYCPETNWAAHIRVSRENFTGISKYRHFPEPDDV